MSGVSMIMYDPWQIDDLPVPYAPFGDDVVGESADVVAASLQDRHLHALFVIQMNMERRLRER
jgi:hypothetical protein